MSSRPPITDSPLFWLLLYGSFALSSLLVIGPKHARREERRLRMFESRQKSDLWRAQQAVAAGYWGRLWAPWLFSDAPGDQAADDASQGEGADPRQSAQPLALWLVTVLLLAALAVALRYRNRPRPPPDA